jgi:hypothetical protein
MLNILSALYGSYAWLILWRVTATESHVLAYLAVGALVPLARYHKKSWKYGILLGTFVIYLHEIVWYALYAAVYDPTDWQRFAVTGIGAYFILRVMNYFWHWNWDLVAKLFIPYGLFCFGWLLLGLPVTFLYYNDAFRFGAFASPLYDSLLANSLEVWSWLVLSVTALLLMMRDKAPHIPFTTKRPYATP